MIKAILTLSCHDYPLWTCDEEASIKYQGLPNHLPVPAEAASLLEEIQKAWDTHFSLDGEAFGFDGLEDEEERAELIQKAELIESILKKEVGSFTDFQNDMVKILMAAPLKKDVKKGPVIDD